MGNARGGIPISELPQHLQREVRVRAKLDPTSNGETGGTLMVDLGPESPLRETGGRARAKRVDREHPIQADIIAWVDDPATLPQYPELKTLYAIPNALGAGGKQSKRHRQLEGARRKAEGMRTGNPDLCLPAPRRGDDGRVYGALYLEIKDEETGTVRKEQIARIRALRAAGNRCDVAMSADAAKAIVTHYLNLSKP